MIIANTVNNSRTLELRLTSDKHNKVVNVMKLSNCWMATYKSNGQRFSKDNYPEVLEHLTNKGW